MYEACKQGVIEEFKSVQFVCCTTDMWVDDFKHLAYMTVTAHILRNFQSKSFVLATRHFPLKHTGMNIAEALKEILKEFKIRLSRTVFVTDNGANILNAMRILGVVHFSCFAHDLNLSLTADGFEKVPQVVRLLEKGKDAVKHFRFKGHEVSKKQKELLARRKELEKKKKEIERRGQHEVNDSDEESQDAETINEDEEEVQEEIAEEIEEMTE
jgi:hypothetical protein